MQVTELDSGIFLYFILQCFGELFIAFVCHNSECVYVKTLYPFAVLIDTQTKSTPNLLPFLYLFGCFVERTDLEHIRIVPTLTQGGVGENKAEWRFEAQQPLLIAHNQIEGIVVFGGFPGSIHKNFKFIFVIRDFPFLIHREISIVNLAYLHVPVFQLLEQGSIFRFLYQTVVFLFEDAGILAVLAVSLRIVLPVVCHLVDKEQAQHFYSLRVEHYFFVKMRLDGHAYLLSLQQVVTQTPRDNALFYNLIIACKRHIPAFVVVPNIFHNIPFVLFTSGYIK